MMDRNEREDFDKDCIQVDKFRAHGHSMHCACRIVWGDGICTCNQTANLPGRMDRIIQFVKRCVCNPAT
jgi:hypothetical protein